MFGLLAGLGFGMGSNCSTRYNSRLFSNIAFKLLGFTFCYYLGYNVHYGVLEPKFINRNILVDDLSKKYDFSVFDFAQAKKESHLKELRKELTSESSNLLYS